MSTTLLPLSLPKWHKRAEKKEEKFKESSPSVLENIFYIKDADTYYALLITREF